MAVHKLSQQEVANQKAQRIMNGIAVWCSFYRANPHRFCKDYLNVHLKLFQKILLFMMNISTHFMYIASRGQGKSFLIAVFCCVRCILYPGTQICIASGSRPQAINVLEKITNILMPGSANLRMEIEEASTNQQNAHITFRNGSIIKVVTANDRARSNRSNILICDEFRMIDLDVVNKVLRKFLTAPRHPKYLDKPEYAHLAERNKEFYLSSAWFKSHWSYEKLKAYCINLVDDSKRYFCCGLPYQMSIRENLLSAEAVADEMSETDFNELNWSMEMECLFYGDNEGSLFSYEDIAANRKIIYPFHPAVVSNLLKDKRARLPAKQKGELRVITADIALMGSRKHENDATSIFVNQLIPAAGNRYISNVMYTENTEGGITSEQALTLRRYFEDFECDYIGLDTSGVGFGVYDAMVREIYDAENGVTYPPLSCCNNAEMAERCADPNAPKVIWSIKGNAQFNSDCALSLREGFRQGKIRLLISEYECDAILSGLHGYNALDIGEKMRFKMPYINTSLLINELINLQYEAKNNTVRVYEKVGFRKDRYSSLSYNYWIANQLELKLNRPKHEVDFAASFCFRKPKIK